MAGFFKKGFSFGKKEVVECPPETTGLRTDGDELKPIDWAALRDLTRDDDITAEAKAAQEAEAQAAAAQAEAEAEAKRVADEGAKAAQAAADKAETEAKLAADQAELARAKEAAAARDAERAAV